MTRVGAIAKPEDRLVVDPQHATPFKGILRLEKARLELQRPVKVEPADIQHLLHRRVRHLHAFDPGHGVHRSQSPFQHIDRGGVDQVHLVDEDHVGKGDLRGGFLAVIQVQPGMFRIDQRDHPVQTERVARVIVDEEGLGDRAGIGQTRRFQQDSVELVAALDQIAQDADEITANGAADAAVVHLEDLFVGVDHQVLIDADLAELVLDDGDALTVVFGQDSVQQRRLAAAEKPGQDSHWNVLLHLSNLVVVGQQG